MMPKRTDPPEPVGHAGGLEKVWARIAEKGVQQEADRAAEREASRPLFAELISMPEDRRREAIASDDRFWRLAMADRLLQATERTSAGTAQLHAELALAIVERLEERRYGASSLAGRAAVAWSLWADARRRQGELDAAESGFRHAARRLSSELLDAWERAAYCRRLAALRQDQERDDEALGLLLRAIELYRLWGEPLLEAEALCEVADLWLAASDPETALQVLQEAKESAGTPTALPYVPIRVQHGLARCYSQLGQAESSDKALLEAQSLYGLVLHPIDRLRHLWAEAQIAMESGHTSRALALLKPTLRKMIEEGAFYDTALVALDLAQVVAERGQFLEVRRIAEQVAPIVAAKRLPELAGSVLRFALRFASRLRPGVVEILAQASDYLKRTRENPRYPVPWEGEAVTELPWDDQPVDDLKRSLCEEAGLPLAFASLAATEISLQDRQLMAWTYQVGVTIRLRFAPPSGGATQA